MRVLVKNSPLHRTRFPLALRPCLYFTSHAQLANTDQLLSSHLGNTIVDGEAHPSQIAAAIHKITIADIHHLSDSWFKTEILGGLNGEDVEFVDPSTNEGECGIIEALLTTPGDVVQLLD